jgi:hypothetical protein
VKTLENNNIEDSKKKARKNWDINNREQSNYIKARNSAKSFIRKANKDDLKELQTLINTRLEED